MNIPFNKPYMTGGEFAYISQACEQGQLAGNGVFTKKCNQWLEDNIGCKRALLTHSCTAALEMAAILLDVEPGDEIIMPSYTFVSTANAFVLRGGVPVFVDIREDTLNINEMLIEDAITSRTKAIVPVHYAGVSCEMDVILDIAQRYNLMVVEDAAQGLGASYKGRALGSMGDLGTLSFHETKNIISGEGGALLINNPKLIERAEIVHDKGTNRSKFLKGQVDKYTWVDIGSSYLAGELVAAFLWAQLQEVKNINTQRLEVWDRYNRFFRDFEQAGKMRGPFIPASCQHNAHMYYIVLSSKCEQQRLIKAFEDNEILAPFHYVPLHLSPAGIKYARTNKTLKVTIETHSQLIRLPLWTSMTKEVQSKVVNVLRECF